MFRLLYTLYFVKVRYKSIYQLYTRIIIRIANELLPLYFKFTAGFKGNRLEESTNQGNEQYIISLTSFPVRINKVWLAIESILHQKVKPDAILLWLYKGEFKGKEYLPKRLLDLEKRGLQIKFCDDNLMPHKKYYYTMLEYPDANVITVDDDMFYPSDLLEKLIRFHQKFPLAICCPITRKIKIENQKCRPYIEWKYLTSNTEPEFQNLTMGGGGTLFPPKSLHQDVFNKEDLLKYVLRTDDLWLKVMSLRNNTKIVSMAGEYPRFFIPIYFKNNVHLMNINIGKGENDKIFNELMKHYRISLSIFKNKD